MGIQRQRTGDPTAQDARQYEVQGLHVRQFIAPHRRRPRLPQPREKLGPRSTVEPWEVRLRVAARCDDRGEAVRVGNEVETLYTNGPSGGGGASKSVRQVVAVASLLLPRDKVNPRIEA